MSMEEIFYLIGTIGLIILVAVNVTLDIIEYRKESKKKQEQDEQEFCDHMIIQQGKALREKAFESLQKIKHNHGYDDSCYNQEIADAYKVVEKYIRHN